MIRVHITTTPTTVTFQAVDEKGRPLEDDAGQPVAHTLDQPASAWTVQALMRQMWGEAKEARSVVRKCRKRKPCNWCRETIDVGEMYERMKKGAFPKGKSPRVVFLHCECAEFVYEHADPVLFKALHKLDHRLHGITTRGGCVDRWVASFDEGEGE